MEALLLLLLLSLYSSIRCYSCSFSIVQLASLAMHVHVSFLIGGNEEKRERQFLVGRAHSATVRMSTAEQISCVRTSRELYLTHSFVRTDVFVPFSMPCDQPTVTMMGVRSVAHHQPHRIT